VPQRQSAMVECYTVDKLYIDGTSLISPFELCQDNAIARQPLLPSLLCI